MREAVENGFPCEGPMVTGLKAGVNEKLQLGDRASLLLAAFNRRHQFRCG